MTPNIDCYRVGAVLSTKIELHELSDIELNLEVFGIVWVFVDEPGTEKHDALNVQSACPPGHAGFVFAHLLSKLEAHLRVRHAIMTTGHCSGIE